MKCLIYKFNNTSLFIKIALITFTCSLCIFIFTSLVTLNISKNVLIDTFSNSNYKILNEVSKNYANLNDNIANVIYIIEYNPHFKEYLTEDYNNSKNDFFLLYNIDKAFDVLPDDVYSNLNIFIVGRNGKTFLKGHNCFSFNKYELMGSNLKEKIVASRGKLIYGYNSYKQVNSHSYSTEITAAKAIINKDTNEIYGYVYIVIPQNEFRKFYMPFVGVSNNIKILDQDGTIVSSSIHDEIGEKDNNTFDVSNMALSNNINVHNQKYNGINAAIL